MSYRKNLKHTLCKQYLNMSKTQNVGKMQICKYIGQLLEIYLKSF